MGKSKVRFWIIIIFYFSLLFTLYGEEPIQIKKGYYVPFSELKKHLSSLEISVLPPLLMGEIKNNKGQIINFRVDSSYYSYRGMVEKLFKPVRYKKGEIFLPRDLVEAIFLKLVEEELSYEFKESALVLKVYRDLDVDPEELELRSLIIDPGHGGKDPGVVAESGDSEKELTLKVAKILKKYLKRKFPDLKVKFTRKKDQFVSLDERAKYANSKLQNFRDSIFVSLHCNSSPKQTETSNGFEIYYLAQTLPVETAREISIVSHGLTDKTKNESVQKIQSGMLSSVIQRRSVVLARSIAEKLTVALDKKLSNRGVKKNNYHVLRSSLMPAVLIELGFLTSPDDVKALTEKEIQEKIAEGIMEGIKSYAFAKN